MEAPCGTDLPESFFFTARKARIRSRVQESAGASSSVHMASSSSQFYSARMHSIMQHMSEVVMSKEDEEIYASEDHWTEVLAERDRLKALHVENMEEVRRLQRENPESKFFQIGDGPWVLGRKIAEGGQAEIYEVFENDTIDKGGKDILVMKVFKAGYSLQDMREQWPLDFLHEMTPLNYVNNYYESGCIPMLCGRLLGDGRFGFMMYRLWGDLRKLMDLRMQLNGNQYPPFMMENGNYHEYHMLNIIHEVAQAMKGMHKRGVLHRDLKASNILIRWRGETFDITKLTPDIVCYVADYECSIGVVGTGYWRAPEILEALKNGTVHTTPNLFTPKSDVYSFAMTCYEILTGCKPFEECEGNAETLEEVLKGRRPTLPSHLKPWMKNLLNSCWHTKPLERPTFEEICKHLYR